ncbi:hypothetical protein E2I00_000019, partial [Balaenoptera physalus]
AHGQEGRADPSELCKETHLGHGLRCPPRLVRLGPPATGGKQLGPPATGGKQLRQAVLESGSDMDVAGPGRVPVAWLQSDE